MHNVRFAEQQDQVPPAPPREPETACSTLLCQSTSHYILRLLFVSDGWLLCWTWGINLPTVFMCFWPIHKFVGNWISVQSSSAVWNEWMIQMKSDIVKRTLTHSLGPSFSCNCSITKICHHFTVGHHHLTCIHPITNNKCGYNIAGSFFIDWGNHCEHWSNLVKWRNVGPFLHLKIIIHVLYSRAYFKMVVLSKPIITLFIIQPPWLTVSDMLYYSTKYSSPWHKVKKERAICFKCLSITRYLFNVQLLLQIGAVQ